MNRNIACNMLVIVCLSTISLFRVVAQVQLPLNATPRHYAVQNLGSLGGTSCCLVVTVNDIGWVDGTSNLAGDKNFHPFLWIDGHMQDLGTLGGPNSSAGGMNNVGDVTVGGADTTTPDPLGEDWCGFGTHLICRSYIWHAGRRSLVPTLGGNNGDVSTITNSGLVLGFAETPFPDSTCIAPQVLGFDAFLWWPDQNEIRTLPPLPGDTATAAFDVNQQGNAVGTSGICGGGLVATSALHAVAWRTSLPKDLGSLGGAYGNLAISINNQGQIVGQSDLIGDAIFHAFLWTEERGLEDLGTLSSDSFSTANSINDTGQIAIQSCDASFNCRAVIWENGVMTDLNTLIPGDSPLLLISANSINARGQIAGAAFDRSTGATIPYLATPCDQNEINIHDCWDATQGNAITGPWSTVLPENIRKQLRQHLGFRRFGTAAISIHVR